MKVYIAAPYQEIQLARLVMRELGAEGIGCTSRWLTEDSSVENDEWARKDLSDVAACDVLVALNPNGYANSGTGGRHVELGFALALHKPVVLVGERTNIFHHLLPVFRIDDAAHLPLALRTWAGAMDGV